MAYGYTMTLDTFVQNTYLIATGKITPPVSGTNKYSKITALGNLFTQEWAGEPGVDWNSQRSIFTVSGTVGNTDTFTLPSTMGDISRQEGDFVRIITADGLHEYEYTIVPPSRLYASGPKLNSFSRGGRINDGDCAKIGTNLVFDRKFVSTDPQYGGTITVPGFIIPPTLVNGADVVSVDNPLWLVYRTAAEYIRSDITRVQLYGSLTDLAAAAMEVMKEQNESQRESAYTGGWNPLFAGGGGEDSAWS